MHINPFEHEDQSDDEPCSSKCKACRFEADDHPDECMCQDCLEANEALCEQMFEEKRALGYLDLNL